MLGQIKEKIAHKIPRLPRWGRCGIALLSVVACIAFSGLIANAESVNYSFSTSQPQLTGDDCYLEVLTQNGGAYYIYVKNVSAHTDRQEIVHSNYFTADISGNDLRIVCPTMYTGSETLYGFYVGAWGNVGNLYNHDYYLSFYFGNDPIVGIHGYGCDVSAVRNTSVFTFSYGADTYIQNKIDSINSVVESFKGQNHEQLSQILQAIISQGNSNTQQIKDNADKNASNIQSNNDKNTQSIIDNQNQLAEQEKTDTQNSADNSVSDVSGSVPDKSAGMLSALQSLSNAVSYTGTSAKWTFPQMYIPAIAGVTDRINLNSSTEIDFTYWVNQIPQDIRTVISALSTIGLVVFAFKELYGLISYVLTLKGGGNNE